MKPTYNGDDRKVIGKFVLAMLGALMTALTPSSGLTQVFVSGSTGADRPFNPTCAPTPCTVTIQLSAIRGLRK